MMNNEKIALWEERIKEKQDSGLSVEEWCQQNQLTKHSYYYWKKRIETINEKTSVGQAVVFAEISKEVTGNTYATPLEVTWRDLSISITGHADAVLAAEFLSQLQKRC